MLGSLVFVMRPQSIASMRVVFVAMHGLERGVALYFGEIDECSDFQDKDRNEYGGC